MQTWSAMATTFSILTACSGGSQTTPSPQATRGLSPTHQIPFSVEVKVRREGTADRTIDSGGSVTSGDGVYVEVTPSEDVYVYLGFCNGSEFALFPQSPGSLRAPAASQTRIPEDKNTSLTISGDSTSEVLYVIITTNELSPGSPDLKLKIDAARREPRSAAGGVSPDGDCVPPQLDSAGKPIPREASVAIRPSDSAIEVKRYEFKHLPSSQQ
jgi:hypothetical protein